MVSFTVGLKSPSCSMQIPLTDDTQCTQTHTDITRASHPPPFKPCGEAGRACTAAATASVTNAQTQTKTLTSL